MREALERYRSFMQTKGNKAGSIDTTIFRLRSLLTDQDEYLVDLTRPRCQELYDRLSERTKADTHRNTLGQARTFFRWAKRRGYVAENPLGVAGEDDAVNGVGKRRRGKPQIYIDEARRFIATCLPRAEAGDRAALGALMILLLGMRPTEVLTRTARDIDDGGRVLWIPESKTELGRRTLMVGPPLVELLRAAAREGDPIFPSKDHRWLNRKVKKLCALAGVSKVPSHGLRGSHSSIGSPFAESQSAVARALGHDEEVNRAHYTTAAAAAEATQRRLRGRLGDK